MEKDYPHWVCTGCGMLANGLTCLKKFGKLPKQYAFVTSTYHVGDICDICGNKESAVTEARDFFYPDFELIKQVKKLLYDSKS